MSGPNPQPRRILFLLLSKVNLLDLGGPAQVFETARFYGAPYQISFHAFETQIISAQGLPLGPLSRPPTPEKDDLVILPGPELSAPAAGQPLFSAETLRWLQQAHAAGAQLASVCTGAAILGEAGLLDGRHCTTHWSLIEHMRHRYPLAKVQDGVLFAQDGNITTSAGIASGMDMSLALIEQEHGPLFTARVARYLVLYMRRGGSHSQQSIYLDYRTHLHSGVHQVQDHLAQQPGRKTTLPELATMVRLSPRGLSKAFKQHTGLTPLEYQQKLRLELAKQLMHNPQLTLESIAQRCGFEDARHFRRIWKEHFGTSPSLSRMQFQQ
ncbi:GlxA family transcriptional regulator [Deinococcus cellulosilyticus]|uniref:AraC family transcriptional regulator n=1 Tax=Deinococcus cellulosilyticus (strain DSM 18568 / NBRC 106333 / KACC 11606 / 5516J-15) TaxID=1223518 RepID=A0A511MWN6_DEIC1|nr:helix-turn-helix domain-containing protein [Deinococcus cellulosilyticus]GEM44587.1 AraC family transcriptional regulator [Deinococcus cellulosilyticus NBRC 106333 = KACC 11606]